MVIERQGIAPAFPATQSGCRAGTDHRVEPTGGLARVCRLVLAVACLGLTLPAKAADPEGLSEVGVRSAVQDKYVSPPGTSGPQGVAGQGRIYGFVAVQRVPSADPLIKPIDVLKLLDLIRRGLDRQGFHPVEKGLKPEILIAVRYGRGWLTNPYLGDFRDSPTSIVIDIADASAAPAGFETIVGSTEQLMEAKLPGHEAKLQKAAYEKLFIRVEAWQYPSSPDVKPKLLWKTTMVADDPDHRDLNTIAWSMVAAGAPYFAQQIKDGEIDVAAPVLEGRVNVGTPKVVEPAPRLAGHGVADRVTAARVADAPRKQFDIPDGDAAQTLKAFSEQSGDEIIYPVDQVRAITTHGIKGEMTARDALARMLRDTRLVTAQDEKTGAFAVRLAAER